jgi:low affinity Fe/Cu permease
VRTAPLFLTGARFILGTWNFVARYFCSTSQRRCGQGNLMAGKTKSKNGRTNPGVLAHFSEQFAKLAQKTAVWTGHPIAFLSAAAVVVLWIVTGPLFDYSDTWQLVINTGTTIITFMMVFLIQNTQNRDMVAVQLKLSELVLSIEGAENKYASIEDLTEEELEKLHDECRTRAEMTLSHLEQRRGKQTNAEQHRRAAHSSHRRKS